MSEIRIIEKTENITYSSLSTLLLEIHTKSGMKNSATGVTGDAIKESLNGGTVFVAMEGNEPIGMVAVCKETSRAWYHNGDCGRIRYMGVLPQCQGKHIGGDLLKEGLNWAFDHELSAVLVSTSEQNKKAIRLYSRYGCNWVDYGKVKGTNRYYILGIFLKDKSLYSIIYIRTRFIIKRGIVMIKHQLGDRNRLK